MTNISQVEQIVSTPTVDIQQWLQDFIDGEVRNIKRSSFTREQLGAHFQYVRRCAVILDLLDLLHEDFRYGYVTIPQKVTFDIRERIKVLTDHHAGRRRWRYRFFLRCLYIRILFLTS